MSKHRKLSAFDKTYHAIIAVVVCVAMGYGVVHPFIVK